MNISYKWLKDYIDLEMSPDEVAAVLTSTGLETGSVDEVESIRGGLRGIVIGKVLTCVDHPDSDHLHITTVDLGDGNATTIVCGAPNVAAGQTVVVATVGTTLYDGDKEFQIKKSKIRGVESMGMICAHDEIGTGTSHEGIIVIDEDIKPGTPAAQYFGLTSDYVLEVDLTPNRIDAASHYGVARDLAAWLACHATPATLRRPDVSAFKVDDPAGNAVSVEVENPAACVRYCGVTIRGVKVAESPAWLKERLAVIGQHPINNVVDITNYILNAIGQPLHCFDLSKIDGGKVVVKNAVQDAPFVTLDGVEHKLDARDLMINNATGPMCIAGVMGGLESGSTTATTDIFIESACFDPTTVRKSARRHGINSDSSFRFERGVDPNGCLYALKLAALMVKEIAGGTVTGDVVDIYPTVVEPARVAIDYGYMDSLIGKQLPHDVIDSILSSLEMKTASREGDTLHLDVPTYRVDVQRPCDVVEDVLRIYGYNNVEFGDTVHSSLSYKTPTDAADDLRRLLSEQLTATGFNEILNNSLTAERYYRDNTVWPLETCVRLLNPLSSDLSVMRQTLLYGGLESIAHNINRKSQDLMMYEFGNIYRFNPAAEGIADKPLAPYSEGARLGVWMTGLSRAAAWNQQAAPATVYDLKGVVANLLARLGINERETQLTVAAPDAAWSASLLLTTRSGKKLGQLGTVAAAQLKATGIKQPVYYAELDWDALVKLSLKSHVSYKPLPKTMPVERDLALLIDNNVTMEQITAVVNASEKKLLKGVKLFDVYEGKNLPEGKKSYAIKITLQDDEKTLNDKAIEVSMGRIVANLTRQLGAELR